MRYAVETLASTVRVVDLSTACTHEHSRPRCVGDSFGRVGSVHDPAAVGRAHLIAAVCNAMGGHPFSTEIPSIAVQEPVL